MSILLYAAALMLVSACVFINVDLRDRDARRVEERLARMTDVSLAAKELPSPRPPRLLISSSFMRQLERAATHVGHGWLIFFGAAVIVVPLILAVAVSGAVALVAFIAGVLAISKFLCAAAARREEQFLTALPALLDHMRQSVAAGNGVYESFLRAIAVAPQICREELQPIALRVKMGADFYAAVQLQAERLGLKEIFVFAIILQTHQRYGGSLYESLSNYIEILRAREKVRREFKAVSSEIRSSASFLMLLPAFVAAVILLTKPRHFDYFLTASGLYVGLGIIGLMMCGVLIIRRLSSLRY